MKILRRGTHFWPSDDLGCRTFFSGTWRNV